VVGRPGFGRSPFVIASASGSGDDATPGDIRIPATPGCRLRDASSLPQMSWPHARVVAERRWQNDEGPPRKAALRQSAVVGPPRPDVSASGEAAPAGALACRWSARRSGATCP
jgi:hypothetical protein